MSEVALISHFVFKILIFLKFSGSAKLLAARWVTKVQFPAGTQFSPHHWVQTGSEAYLVTHSVDSFTRGKQTVHEAENHLSFHNEV
jgi:hypothetical protein